ncbi:MAG: DUF4091 domain-containing protein [Lentisphaerae bacterium]|jgi:hypothetical protein|nr:DUF4091 domain-containing protein [Lentisphaerota bacterium]
MIQTRFISSLEKVFPVQELSADEITCGQALRGEVFSFQIAFLVETGDSWKCLSISVDGPLARHVTIRTVRNMPSDLPTSNRGDHNLYYDGRPGLYPDLLYPLEAGGMFKALASGWTALWITVRIPEEQQPGLFDIPFHVVSFDGNPLSPDGVYDKILTYRLEILSQVLLPQKLKRLEWLHADCIYKQYRVEPWSEAYWTLLEKYIGNAADHGINMLYTPLWTPPLDTAVGTERPTIQLLEIEKQGEKFVFNFSRLTRYLKLAQRCGMKFFEMSHAFTQWGAHATPKIMVKVDGREEKYFGWHVPAESSEYASFLAQLMKQLLPLLRSLGLSGKCWFAVSDEPTEEHLESFRHAANLMRSVLEEFPTLDALSDPAFLEQGLVQNPIPYLTHIQDFRGKVQEVWAYYCCIGDKIPNRFFAMTSGRTRVIGILLWLHGVSGFLQWGFNFWYTQYSLDTEINVFATTDANRSFPSGDAFLVYPGAEGPLDSLRNELMREAMQDVRLLELAASKLGRPAVEEMIRKDIAKPITMTEYPCSAEWILELRQRLMAALQA